MKLEMLKNKYYYAMDAQYHAGTMSDIAQASCKILIL